MTICCRAGTGLEDHSRDSRQPQIIPWQPLSPFAKHTRCRILALGSTACRESAAGSWSKPHIRSKSDTAQHRGARFNGGGAQRGSGDFSGIIPSSPSSRMDAGALLSPDTQRGAANIYPASLPRCSPTAPNIRRATCGATAAPRGTSLLSAELTARRDGAERSGWGAAPSAGGGGKGEARLHQSHSEKGRRAAAPLLLAGIRAKHLLPALSSRSCEEAGAQPAPECSRAGAGTSASPNHASPPIPAPTVGAVAPFCAYKQSHGRVDAHTTMGRNNTSTPPQ